MTYDDTVMIAAEGLAKSFTLHLQGATHIPVLGRMDFAVRAGECAILDGPSGAGKSTLMRCIYANYLPQEGRVLIRHDGDLTDITHAEPRAILDIRRRSLGYVSQFLRVIPRVGTLDLVMEPLLTLGVAEAEAKERAATLLSRLRIPERMWRLPPGTFSGGEQQRVNIARVMVVHYPALLLDEPTASLDADNRQTVVDLVTEACGRSAAIVGIFHDAAVREALGNRTITVTPYEKAAA
ncbi:phosphonate C-P lyase system protein PhnL [Oceanibaculum pacificum]|uniref:Phosphonate ABC transporter ATP-binding protein n=1 Tax=Oceanibaculum pacificum TaxID=580166 RepID=A0A154W5Z6_9PROT|nr:phosphonate C-P lyase system protein PhnL [Oceanibaculum pacificum]KZD08980.1 phosphonate ABC transporter ATP-binding protein [Oceanibaculum pacificum]